MITVEPSDKRIARAFGSVVKKIHADRSNLIYDSYSTFMLYFKEVTEYQMTDINGRTYIIFPTESELLAFILKWE
jgi:hypothetical protein